MLADDNFVPVQTVGSTERFDEGLLGCETTGQRSHRGITFGLDKKSIEKLWGFCYGALKPGQIDQVNADTDDHEVLFDRYRLGEVSRLVNVKAKRGG